MRGVPRVLGSLVSPRGKGAALSVLIFHRVLAEPDPLFPGEPDAARFDALLSWLADFNVMPLDGAIDALEAGTLPSRAVAITFDDGYADNHDVALPILRRHALPATFFIATDFLDGGRMWNDTVIEAVRRCPRASIDLRELGLGAHALGSVAERRSAIEQLLGALKYLPLEARRERVAAIAQRAGASLPDDLMMSTDQLRRLRDAGMLIGGHTRAHPILARLDDAAAFDEIAGGKARLEALLGERIALFAYPNGQPGRDYAPRHRDMVRRAGYRAAVSTSSGAARHGADVFQLPRFTPWDRSRLRFGLRLVDNMRRPGVLAA